MARKKQQNPGEPEWRRPKANLGSSGPIATNCRVQCTSCKRILGSNQLKQVSQWAKKGRQIRCPFCRECDCLDTPIEAVISIQHMLEIQNEFRSAWTNSPIPTMVKVCPVCGADGSTVWWHTHTSNGFLCQATGHGISPDLRDAIECEEAPRLITFDSMAKTVRGRYKQSMEPPK